MNSTRTPRTWGLARLLALTLPVFAAQAAFAQDTAAPDAVKLETYVVTGSLLPKTEGETFVPLTTYSADKLLQFGASTPVEGLRSLPSFFGATNTELDSNGGDGSATVNLRGLGGTLTLVNGRRAFGFEDLNLLPIDAIQQIDILKDGAGSVYGADALAGVVNIVLKKKWVGSRLRVNYGLSDNNDARQYDASFLVGTAFDGNKGYITVTGSYADKDTLFARDRKLSANADGRPFGGQNGGSPTFAGHIGGAASGILLNTGVIFPTSAADYHPFNPSTESFNFRLFSPSIPGQERKLIHFASGYELYGKQVEPYVEFDWANQYTDNGLAPAPFALPNATARNSVYNPFGAPGTTIPGNTVRYRPTDVEIRRTIFDKTDYRAVIGLKGSFDNGWGYDAAALKADDKSKRTEKNGILRSAIVAETDAGRFNPFARAGSTGTFRGSSWDNTKAITAALASGQKPIRDTLKTYDFKLFGPAMELPAGKVDVALGYEWRKTHSTFTPSAVYFSGDLLGFNSGNPRDASSKNQAFFGEASIPIVSAKNNVAMIKELSVTANLRFDNASVHDNINGLGRSFGSDTRRFGVRYQPLDDLVLRATYGTGFRVPDLDDLFDAPGNNFPTLTDPLRFPIGQQTDVATQGNPNLTPETSVSKGVGFIYSPKGAPGLNITVDFYRTKLGGLVSDGAQFILNQNAATQGAGFPIVTPTSVVTDPNALFANRIRRDPVTGALDDQVGSAIDSTNFNVASRTSTGLDYSITYRQPKNSWGQLTHLLEFNQVLTWDLVPETGSPKQDFVGKFVDTASNALAPGSIPRWKGFYNLLWEKNAWTVSFTANYINAVLDDPNTLFLGADGNPAKLDLKTGLVVPSNDVKMERYVTFDIVVSYEFKTDNKWLKGTTLRVGVQNIGDEPPPFSSGAFNDNYDTSLYSTRGRFFNFGVVKTF